MRALVTGATGFVGSHLVEALREHGDEVTALVRSPTITLTRLGVHQLPGRLRDRPAIEQAAAGQDVVFHVAGLTAARREAEFVAVNRDGTAAMVEAATHMGAGRFVLISSMAAGGPSVPGRPATGAEPARPVTAYGRSKLAAEEIVRASPLGWTIVRPPMVYGPRDREVLKVFQLAKLGLAPIFGDGSQELSAVHAADLARALVATVATERAIGQTYYPCHPQTFTSAMFVRAVASVLGRRVAIIPVPKPVGRAVLSVVGTAARAAGWTTLLTADKANEFFQPAWTADPTPCMRDTGWAARFDLERGLADTSSWYRSAGWL